MPTAKYKVFVDDNFNYMDEEDRAEYGQFETLEAAVATCRGIVDKFLLAHYKPGMSAAELHQDYTDGGDDPFIVGGDTPSNFSAWNYARRRCAELCGVALPQVVVAPFDADEAREHQAAWGAYFGLPVEITNTIGMKLALIPPGEFAMGSRDELITEELHTHLTRWDWEEDCWFSARLAAEKPRHPVRINRPFYLGVYEVTQREYEQIVGANPSAFSAAGERKDQVVGQDTPRLPVDCVSWDDAVEFCRKLSELPAEKAAGRAYGLPTEAQWEYACRAGSTGRFGFDPGDESRSAKEDEKRLADYAWLWPHTFGVPHPVGHKLANAWGLYEMHGSVWEWCHDWFDEDYYRNSPLDDPVGPPAGSSHAFRVIRGGSLNSMAWRCRSAFRSRSEPGNRQKDLGFRVSLIAKNR